MSFAAGRRPDREFSANPGTLVRIARDARASGKTSAPFERMSNESGMICARFHVRRPCKNAREETPGRSFWRR
ncbi:Hypothetical protein BN69_1334 [Methylocystis sp. SC2]|nr:Hypothetical protein BN69_1334 [Methylocystis sp. SC2]